MTADKHRSRWIQALAILGLLAIIIPSHGIGIDKFATIDEPWWVISGSNFYYALAQRDFENTIYDYHPAVTTTWVVTAGMLFYYPEYRGQGQGYFDVRKIQYENFMKEHDRPALGLVRISRWIQTLVIAGLALLSFFCLLALFDIGTAFLAVTLAASAPLFLGYSRLLNHEGMLSMFVLVSLLGMLAYLYRGRNVVYLLVSAVSAGFAQLTKSSSIVLLPVVGLMLLVTLFEKGESKPPAARFWESARALGIWLIVLALVFVIFWPGMWVNPGKMLYEVYGNAFSYAFKGSRLEVADGSAPPQLNLASAGGAFRSYTRDVLLHTTPITWIGVIFGILALFVGKNDAIRSLLRLITLYLTLTALLFILMFSLASGRDSAHYILTSYVCLDIVAGIGWIHALRPLGNRLLGTKRPWAAVIIPILIVMLQLAGSLPFHPYYITYNNPILASAWNVPPGLGYGEGLERAAEYLAQKPDAGNLSVYAYNGIGPFSYFFPGQTDILKKAYFWLLGLGDVVNGIQNSDYLVVYTIVQKQLPECEKFLKALETVRPEKVINIYGVDYARIYRVADIPDSFYAEISR